MSDDEEDRVTECVHDVVYYVTMMLRASSDEKVRRWLSAFEELLMRTEEKYVRGELRWMIQAAWDLSECVKEEAERALEMMKRFPENRSQEHYAVRLTKTRQGLLRFLAGTTMEHYYPWVDDEKE